MRRVKQISITKYITVYLIALVAVISVFMAVFVNLLADRMIHYDIQGTMIKKIVQNTRQVFYVDGKLVAGDEFENEDDGVYFQVLSQEGEILLGENPEGVNMSGDVITQKLHRHWENGKEYYVLTKVNQRLTKEAGSIVYSRGIAGREDMESRYQAVKYISYGCSLAFVLIVAFWSYFFSKRISEPLKQMSKTAETIGEEGELSRRMEYDGKIKELAVLADTNNQMLERVENMFDTQRRFSGDVAHELRTPLTVLLAQCEYAKEHAETKEEFDESIDVIYRHAIKTNQIVTQLLKLNRLESGRVVLDFEEADLDEILRSICEDEEWKNEGKVTFQTSFGGVQARVDVGLVLILFQNIVQNAVKYSELPATVEIHTYGGEENVFISVKDHGCGIREEDRGNLFVPFYRADKSRNSEGFGLGLSIADRIVKMHRGRIEVTSKWGEGSTFTVVLPKNQK